MGAWIEMFADDCRAWLPMSLPTWERGLKFKRTIIKQISVMVAPYMGAWIEIELRFGSCEVSMVAPYMGAWIEICSLTMYLNNGIVAPYMGAWIEINLKYNFGVKSYKSLPTWERGLKFLTAYIPEYDE